MVLVVLSYVNAKEININHRNIHNISIIVINSFFIICVKYMLNMG